MPAQCLSMQRKQRLMLTLMGKIGGCSLHLVSHQHLRLSWLTVSCQDGRATGEISMVHCASTLLLTFTILETHICVC